MVLGLLVAACGSDDDGNGGPSETGGTPGSGATGGSGGGSGGTSGASGSGGTNTGGSSAVGGSSGSGGSGATGGSSTGGGGASGGTGGTTSATCVALAKGPFEGSDRAVPGQTDRAYDIHVPPGYDCTKPTPVVVVLHPGGHDKADAAKLTCPSDTTEPTNPNAPGCLNAVADQKGFVLVYPNGTKNPLLPNQNVRTFNAGGGENGYTCVSLYACTQKVDELAYFNALLDDVEKLVNVDPKRVFATGFSNGGAMTHKLGCTLANRIAAIASVSGGNQYAANATCAPGRPVPVLHVHGDTDGCWPYLGGNAGCLATGKMVTIPAGPSPVVAPSTIGGWVQRNTCGATPAGSDLPNPVGGDGKVHLDAYGGCAQGADVELYTVQGGGHFWPGGYTYDASLPGVKNKDVNTSELVLDFFSKHAMP